MKTNLTLKAAAIVCALSLSAVPAFAHDHDGSKDGRHHMMMKHGPFGMLDANHDGVITKAEADAHFAKIDANHDGKITREEFMQFMKKAHGKFMKHGMQCKPGQGEAKADFSHVNP